MVDHFWNRLVGKLNASTGPYSLPAAKTIVMKGYGWSEFIAPRDCRDDDEIKLFFQKSGAWLALLHLMCAADMHEENVIASGDDPVPIDLEMILQPRLTNAADRSLHGGAAQLAGQELEESVISVGLLPGVFRTPQTKVLGVGGMNVKGVAGTSIKLQAVNTDAMSPIEVPATGEELHNLPTLASKTVDPRIFVDDVIRGFTGYATYLSGQGRRLLEEALAHEFSLLTIRVVLRTTRFYGMLLNRLKEHDTWTDGVTWGVQADFVSRFVSFSGERDRSASLLRYERHALWELNIPYFLCGPATTAIGPIRGNKITLDGIDALSRASEKIRRFDAAEIERQAQIVSIAFATANVEANNVGGGSHPKILPAATVGYDKHQLVDMSRQIVEKLTSRAIASDGALAWIGLCGIADTDAYQLSPLGQDFYSGTSGIAFYLAAHASVAGDEHSKELAVRALSGLRAILKHADAARFIRVSGIGGALGLGSYIYALASCGQFLNDEGMTQDAVQAAAHLTTDMIAADQAFDVTGGSAGAILTLLHAYRITKSDRLLKTAVACGEYLLTRRTETAGEFRTWPYLEGRPLTGYSHGASGYAHALAALGMYTDNTEFTEAADASLRFERRAYSTDHHNWPDLRGKPADPVYYHACQWCHGAGGIGLARLAMIKLSFHDMNALHEDLNLALDAVQERWPMHADSLCCGNLGNIQLLLDAGRLGIRPELVDLAGRRLRTVVEGARMHGTYSWIKGTNLHNFGLFTGLAGAGYSMLRLVDESLPNPLTWE